MTLLDENYASKQISSANLITPRIYHLELHNSESSQPTAQGRLNLDRFQPTSVARERGH